jgi:hypothetical protein
LLLFFKKEGLFFFEKKNQKTFILKEVTAVYSDRPRTWAAW